MKSPIEFNLKLQAVHGAAGALIERACTPDQARQ